MATNQLDQSLFSDKPDEINWCGVDFDGDLNFGIATNPRYTWASERWRGYEKIGETVEKSGYKPLTMLWKEGYPVNNNLQSPI